MRIVSFAKPIALLTQHKNVSRETFLRPLVKNLHNSALLGILCFWIALAVKPAFGQAPVELLSPGWLPQLREGTPGLVSSADPREGEDFITVEPDEGVTFASIKGPGVITRLWFAVKPSVRVKKFGRTILLRAYWDGERSPSIDCPFNDFFGGGFGEYVHFTSLFLGMSSGGYYCYFPMPFQKSARLEIVNQSQGPLLKFYFQVNYLKLESISPEWGYFHAKWRRERETKEKVPYLILEAEGKGHFVGCNVSLQGKPGGGTKFLEGDELIYVDGASEPTLRGTGVEDYFNSGWYFKEGTFDGPLHGCTILDKKANRVSAYRFHLWDVVPFNSSLKVTLGHGEANEEPADFSSVAYWYQKEPHKDFFIMAPAEERLPLEVPEEESFEEEPSKPPPISLPSPELESPFSLEHYAQPARLIAPFLGGMLFIVLASYLLRAFMRSR